MLEIKPIYNSGTISFVAQPSLDLETKIKSKILKDPKGIIPNGIYKVFEYEKRRQIITSIICGLLSIAFMILLSLLIAKVLDYHWITYVPLIFFLALAMTKMILTLIELSSLKKSISFYRESLARNSRTTPPFISKLYIKLNLQQVSHNWFAIFSLFYGTIVLIIFWWLKDVNWWIFDFKKWINDLGPDPMLICYLSFAILVSIMIIFILLTIFRKKRIIDIQAFFGNEVISQVEIEKMAIERNKALRKIFFFSILFILILPIIIRIIWKYSRKKG